MTLRPFAEADIPAARALWGATEGVILDRSDSPERLRAFLAANAGLCFVADEGGSLAGTILCGHDTRRGYLYHLAVAHEFRRRGHGRALVGAAMAALAAAGIRKCHIHVLPANAGALRFWQGLGWQRRDDMLLYSRATMD